MASGVGREIIRAEQRRVERFVKREYWLLAERGDGRFAYSRTPLSHENRRLARQATLELRDLNIYLTREEERHLAEWFEEADGWGDEDEGALDTARARELASPS